MAKLDSPDGYWRAKVDLDQEEIGYILLALTENLEDAHCDNCGHKQAELIKRFIEIDDNLNLRERFRLD